MVGSSRTKTEEGPLLLRSLPSPVGDGSISGTIEVTVGDSSRSVRRQWSPKGLDRSLYFVSKSPL